jgi:hypothetical protein
MVDERPIAMVLDLPTLVRYRNCAEELRMIARDNQPVENRVALFRIAELYDDMANSIEQMLKRPAEKACV